MSPLLVILLLFVGRAAGGEGECHVVDVRSARGSEWWVGGGCYRDGINLKRRDVGSEARELAVLGGGEQALWRRGAWDEQGTSWRAWASLLGSGRHCLDPHSLVVRS